MQWVLLISRPPRKFAHSTRCRWLTAGLSHGLLALAGRVQRSQGSGGRYRGRRPMAEENGKLTHVLVLLWFLQVVVPVLPVRVCSVWPSFWSSFTILLPWFILKKVKLIFAFLPYRRFTTLWKSLDIVLLDVIQEKGVLN